MKKITIGILAHVDAGKTTLSESLLYLSGKIRKQGRVDSKDSFLDYNELERKRGITIYSKEVNFEWKNTRITLLDTPGHFDFSSEMERVLQVLDYGIVVINGNDGIQNHTKTIWKMLTKYNIPTFIFINKMDLSFYTQEELMKQIQNEFGDGCLNFNNKNNEFYENIALINEDLLDKYLDQSITDSDLQPLIKNRKVFPCFFGSALKNQGVDFFMDQFDIYTLIPNYNDEFSGRVYKISRDEQGQKLTHVKITGGSLKVKSIVENEKIDQLRIYDGNKYKMVDEVFAGDVCAIKGFKNIELGQGLGVDKKIFNSILTTYMNYQVVYDSKIDFKLVLNAFKILTEEDPQLNLHYNTATKELNVQLMGIIQLDIIKNMILERFKIEIDFSVGSVIYKETIENDIEGVGHFEPLRHYAEVHLLLEPLPRNSGVKFSNKCSEDSLGKNWQSSILNNLSNKVHVGVLTGSEITDINITLLTGKYHNKHTEGGDFREATYRAVRHGLKRAKSILLEPYYDYVINLPTEYLSTIMYDIEQMHGTFNIQSQSDTNTIISGRVPVVRMENYQQKLISYTAGQGVMELVMSGYDRCHNQEEVIDMIAYDSETDIENPTGSIFCSHGAGFNVPYDEVENYMHLPFVTKKKNKVTYQESYAVEDDLEKIFESTYGKITRRLSTNEEYQKSEEVKKVNLKSDCLIIDGYNIIFGWNSLNTIARENLDAARLKLLDIIASYQGYKKNDIIIVFDAYKVKGGKENTYKDGNLTITYTKEAQTADMYIERLTGKLTKELNVSVATSDAVEQIIILAKGATRISARELELEVEHVLDVSLKEFERKNKKMHAFLLEDVGNLNNL